MHLKIRNPNIEILNKFEIQNVQNRFEFSISIHSCLFRISDLDIRISFSLWLRQLFFRSAVCERALASKQGAELGCRRARPRRT